MNILYDYQAFTQKVGGVSRYHIELINRLPLYGINPLLPSIITDNIYISDSKVRHLKFPVWFFGKYRSHTISWINQQLCKNSVSHSNYDIFHPTFINPYYKKRLKRKPIVVTVHDLIQEKSQRYDTELTKSRRIQQLNHADAIICVSEQTKEDLLNFYPEFSSRYIKVIYHGNAQIAPKYFGPKPYDFPYILYVGRRGKYKNFSSLLNAMHLLPKELHLVCTGSNFSSAEISKIHQLRLSERVIQRFVSDTELMDLFHYAEAFIYPSTMEGFGIPILESFRLGCPAIVSNIKCFNEVGGNGIKYFDPYNIESIAHAITSIIMNPSEREASISYGFNRLKSFSWDNSIKNHIELYNRLV